MSISAAFVMDIGSASVRLIVAEVSKTGDMNIKMNRGYVTRLREDLNSGRGLQGPRSKATLNAVGRLIKESGCDLPDNGACLCTQAVRQAEDKSDFLDALRQITGHEPEIVSGQREGELAWEGSSDLLVDGSLLVDLGGGSTEFIRRDEGKVSVESVPIAAATGRMRSFNDAVQIWRKPLLDLRIRTVDTLVFLGGTATTYAAMHRSVAKYVPGVFHGSSLDRSYLKSQAEKLAKMPEDEILGVPGMEAGRENIIASGGFHLAVICDFFEVEDVLISEKGIRFGRLKELLS